MILPPPSPFPASNSRAIKAGTRFHRVHDQRFDSCAFNPGKGRPSRFAPLFLNGNPIPTQYLATDFECAAHETIFHDVPIDEPNKTVGTDSIKSLAHSVVELKRDVTLVPLFAPDLARWQTGRAELIDTTAASYAITAKWALAIHQNRPDADGLIWTSKRCDPQQSVLLFGDRILESHLTGVSKISIYTSIDEMRQIASFANRVDITIVL